MKANTKLCSTQCSALWKNFLSSNVLWIRTRKFSKFNHKCKCQSHSSTSTIKFKCDDLGIKCQSYQ